MKLTKTLKTILFNAAGSFGSAALQDVALTPEFSRERLQRLQDLGLVRIDRPEGTHVVRLRLTDAGWAAMARMDHTWAALKQELDKDRADAQAADDYRARVSLAKGASLE